MMDNMNKGFERMDKGFDRMDKGLDELKQYQMKGEN